MKVGNTPQESFKTQENMFHFQQKTKGLRRQPDWLDHIRFHGFSLAQRYKPQEGASAQLQDLPHATLASGSCFRCASNTASLIWSQILSAEKQHYLSIHRTQSNNAREHTGAGFNVTPAARSDLYPDQMCGTCSESHVQVLKLDLIII